MLELLQQNTEIIDKLFLELAQFRSVRTGKEKQLDELLYAVATKFPNETRFETALRYIQNAERGGNNIPYENMDQGC